jgi:5'-3' exonuclease
MADTLLLDAPSLIYRAFFALPKSMVDAEGQPVNAIRGFLEMITRLLIDRGPAHLVAAFDADWRPAARVAVYPGYKADRAADPPELPPQFEALPAILDAFGIPRAEAPALEADDAIATLAQRIAGEDRAWIVTGDRDMLALVRTPHVRVLFTVKGVSELRDFGASEVEAEYGVTPEQYGEFAMLRGDPSDGLPGVAGIGPVRAAKLLRAYGSIEGIFGHLAALPPKQAAALEAAREYLAAMARVVPMVTDAPLQLTTAHAPDSAALATMAERYRLTSTFQRLADVWSKVQV